MALMNEAPSKNFVYCSDYQLSVKRSTLLGVLTLMSIPEGGGGSHPFVPNNQTSIKSIGIRRACGLCHCVQPLE
jgi:hypothetical protein